MADATGFTPPLASVSKVGQNPAESGGEFPAESGGEFPAESGGEIDRNPQLDNARAIEVHLSRQDLDEIDEISPSPWVDSSAGTVGVLKN